jgi:hypothetical protein
MGYSTDFEGTIKIEPALTAKDMKKIEKFIEDPTFPSDFYTHHCDYEITEECDGIRWNGSEKSYDMDKILPLLIQKFFKPMGYKLNGVMLAQGESMEDRWRMVVKDNVVKRLSGHGELDPSEPLDHESLLAFFHDKLGGRVNLDAGAVDRLTTLLLTHFTIVRK